MSEKSNNNLVTRAKLISRIASIIVLLVGVFVLFGWVFDIPFLKSVFPNMVTMKANTAGSFLLIGISLLLLQREKIQKKEHTIAQLCAGAVALVGLITLSEYFFGWNLGIDQLLFKEPVGAIGTSHPGRMAPNTALNFLLIGLALLLLDVETRKGYRPSQFLILIEGFIAVFAIVGYAYSAEVFYGFAAYTKMALNTAVTFLVVCIGVLFSRPQHGWMLIILSDTPGGILARKLLPAAILILLGFGWLRLAGERAGLYNIAFGAALFAIVSITIFFIILWSISKSLYKSDLQRTQAEEERKKSEEALKQLNLALNQRTKQVESANKELEAFSYSVSHDLRAPLRHIDGFVQLLQKHTVETLDEKSKRYLTIVTDSVKKMGQLIDDLLAFSQIGRTELRTTRVELDNLIKIILLELQMDLQGRNIDWKISQLPEVNGDPALLQLAFRNLIENAIKFTRSREQAQIEIGYSDGEPNEITFFVLDNGVGFDMQYVDKLFGVFQRLHRTDEFEGTGIGLANIQRIIHRHGGRCWAEGAVDHGATFYFTLPKRS
jgi:signal transduction histidine kinase